MYNTLRFGDKTDTSLSSSGLLIRKMNITYSLRSLSYVSIASSKGSSQQSAI